MGDIAHREGTLHTERGHCTPRGGRGAGISSLPIQLSPSSCPHPAVSPYPPPSWACCKNGGGLSHKQVTPPQEGRVCFWEPLLATPTLSPREGCWGTAGTLEVIQAAPRRLWGVCWDGELSHIVNPGNPPSFRAARCFITQISISTPPPADYQGCTGGWKQLSLTHRHTQTSTGEPMVSLGGHSENLEEWGFYHSRVTAECSCTE